MRDGVIANADRDARGTRARSGLVARRTSAAKARAPSHLLSAMRPNKPPFLGSILSRTRQTDTSGCITQRGAEEEGCVILQIQFHPCWSITRHPVHFHGVAKHDGRTTGHSFRAENQKDFSPRACQICAFFVTGCSLRIRDPSRPFEPTRRAFFRVWSLWALFLLRGDSQRGPLPHMGKLHRGNAITRAPAGDLWRALRIAHPLSRKGSVYRTPDDSDDDAPRRGSVPARPGSFRGPGPCPSSHPSPGRCAGVNPGGQGWVRGRDRARVSHLPRRRRRDLRAGALLPPRGAHFRPLLRAGHRRNRPRALRG